MKRVALLVVISLALAATFGFAQSEVDFSPPPPDGYVNVSEILPLPAFIPGVGALFIHPDNAPVGPWLAYGSDGTLLEVLFMIPLARMQEFENFDNLAIGTFDELGLGAIDHVDVSFNAGHPGMAETHYHIRLVLVDEDTQQAGLTQ